MATTRTNTLYLIRHGENPANLTHEFSYKLVDYSLTPRGVLQAEQTAAFLKDMPFNAFYASPLKRAYETAEIIARPHHLPVTAVESFREVNVGNLELMPPDAESWRLHDQIVADWVDGKPERSFPGGENFLELTRRVRQGLLEITSDCNQQRIVIAAHGGSITAIVHTLCTNLGPEVTYKVMHNCAITEVELTSTDEEVHGLLHSWASMNHLSGEAVIVSSPEPEYAKMQSNRSQA